MERQRLLERQIRKATLPDGTLDSDILIALVDQAYQEQDQARRLNDHAIALMSRELGELNERTRQSIAAQRRDAEARLAAMFDAAVEGVITVDVDGVLVAFNRSAERMFGYQAGEVVGRHMDMLFHGSRRALRAKALQRIASESRLTEAFETKGRRKSGEVFDAEITSTRLEVDGEISIVGLWRDVSARKAQEETLVRARKAAEAANRSKSEFLAAMSHEIRTPMNGVLGMAAALELTGLSEDQRRMVSTITESGRTLMTLLTDILDLSKIEAGRLELEATPFDLAACVDAVVSLYKESAVSKGLAFEAAVTQAACGWFTGDPTRIRQILQNLVANAIKFTDAGRVAVSVDAEGGEGPQAVLCIRVEDTGIGVSKNAQARLFGKFAQADASTTRRFGGSGLGLSICRELVSAMGGQIGIDSEEGVGSCFWARLPLVRASAIESAPTTAIEDAPLDESLRVLVADDNATNRLVLATLLDVLFGLNADYVETGAAAVEAVRTGDYDVVLMDVHMPVMDGLEAARAIRGLSDHRCKTPIIAVSADAMSEQVGRALAAGMDAHVAKPIKPETLLAAIEQALNAHPDRARAA
jgi:PAS domain S-box-containing protein